MEEKKTFKEKLGDTKTAIKDRWYRTCNWCRANKEVIALTAPVAVGGAFELAKTIVKAKQTNDEKALKERYIYDRSNGHYYECRRKVKNREWAEIDARHTLTGESIGSILQDMRLLK